MNTPISDAELEQRYVAIAERLREWIDAQPVVFDPDGVPTINPVYSAHVLLCELIRERFK